MGTEKFKEMLKEMGLIVVENSKKIDGKYNIDAVVLGLIVNLIMKIKTVCKLLQDPEMTYIGANPDMVYPVEDGIFYPDCGSIAKMISFN